MSNIQQTPVSIESLLLNAKSVFNVEELSRYTGLSKSYIYKLTSQRLIPFSRPNGKLIFFRKEDVDKFLVSNRISTTQEIEEAAINHIVNNKGDWR